MKVLVIFLVLVGFVALTPQSFGWCMENQDWKDAPCYAPYQNFSKEKIQNDWAPYYDYKGKEWMEQKKLELMIAIRDGYHEKWYDESDANSNVFRYYYAFYDMDRFQNMYSPHKQLEEGFTFEEIQCKQNLVLMQKHDGSPACVKSDSVIELLTRGWTVKQVPVTFSGEDYECTVNFDRPDSSLIIKYPDDNTLPKNFELIGISTSSGIMTTLSYTTPDFCTHDTNTMSSTGMISIDVTNPDEIKNGKEFVDSYFSENGNNTSFQLVEIHNNVGIAKKSVQENFKESPAKVIFYDEETNMLYTISGYHSTETLMNIALSLQ